MASDDDKTHNTDNAYAALQQLGADEKHATDLANTYAYNAQHANGASAKQQWWTSCAAQWKTAQIKALAIDGWFRTAKDHPGDYWPLVATWDPQFKATSVAAASRAATYLQQQLAAEQNAAAPTKPPVVLQVPSGGLGGGLGTYQPPVYTGTPPSSGVPPVDVPGDGGGLGTAPPGTPVLPGGDDADPAAPAATGQLVIVGGALFLGYLLWQALKRAG